MHSTIRSGGTGKVNRHENIAHRSTRVSAMNNAQNNGSHTFALTPWSVRQHFFSAYLHGPIICSMRSAVQIMRRPGNRAHQEDPASSFTRSIRRGPTMEAMI